MSVIWEIGGTTETGDGTPALFCDNYQGEGCGRPVTLPDGWEIAYD